MKLRTLLNVMDESDLLWLADEHDDTIAIETVRTIKVRYSDIMDSKATRVYSCYIPADHGEYAHWVAIKIFIKRKVK